MKHTPGPWVYNEEDGSVAATSGTPILQLFDNPDSGNDPIGQEQSDFNAKLVCASPALLTALKDLLSECPHNRHTDEDLANFATWKNPKFVSEINAVIAARAAIAQAEGEE